MGLIGCRAGSKFIPAAYLNGSVQQRLAVLAGLMDTDGSLSRKGYDYISKSEKLARGVCFLARSLGLAAYIRQCRKSCQNNFSAEYFRVSISGDTDIIPCRVERKISKPRSQKKDVLRQGFAVKRIGRGKIYGFILDGNGRYLLDDFTVTHNSGKTILACEIIKQHVNAGLNVLFLASLRELIYQAVDKLKQYGVYAAPIMAGVEPDYSAAVQVASVQTLLARSFKRSAIELPKADLLVADECHLAMADTWKRIFAAYPETRILGLTATPARMDNRGLGDLFEKMVHTASIKELTEQGYLVPLKYFAPTIPDLHAIKVTAGDYNQGSLETAMDKPILIGDIVENWARIAKNRLTVVFCSGVKHSMHVRDAFRAVGIPADHVDGSTSPEERQMVYAKMNSGECQVVCNDSVFVLGWDFPPISCCVLARPTKSIVRYIQMIGRILRPSPGKIDAILIDHTGSVYEHGPVEGYTHWELTKGTGLASEHQEKRKKEGKKEIVCTSCKAVYWGRKICPECGNEPKTFGEGIEYRDGYLYEVGKIEMESGGIPRRDWYKQLLWIARDRGFKAGWAAHKYKERFGCWPNGMSKNETMEPGDTVNAFVRKQYDKWRRSGASDNWRGGHDAKHPASGTPRVDAAPKVANKTYGSWIRSSSPGGNSGLDSGLKDTPQENGVESPAGNSGMDPVAGNVPVRVPETIPGERRTETPQPELFRVGNDGGKSAGGEIVRSGGGCYE
ncbi:MAG: DEAD/DEAH box helicase family protein [Candidatus Eisenbacteria bacterium]|nr:DEAD/DEAH box helicase family protein [Candidatus Eisenbacteria bacterium]